MDVELGGLDVEGPWVDEDDEDDELGDVDGVELVDDVGEVDDEDDEDEDDLDVEVDGAAADGHDVPVPEGVVDVVDVAEVVDVTDVGGVADVDEDVEEDDPVGHGVLGEEGVVDPDGDVDVEVEGEGEGDDEVGGKVDDEFGSDDTGLLAGGGTLWSPCPVPPAGRPKYWPLVGS